MAAAAREVSMSENEISFTDKLPPESAENSTIATGQRIWSSEEVKEMILNEIREIQKNKQRADTTSVCHEVLKKHGLSKSTTALELGYMFASKKLTKAMRSGKESFRINEDRLSNDSDDKESLIKETSIDDIAMKDRTTTAKFSPHPTVPTQDEGPFPKYTVIEELIRSLNRTNELLQQERELTRSLLEENYGLKSKLVKLAATGPIQKAAPQGTEKQNNLYPVTPGNNSTIESKEKKDETILLAEDKNKAMQTKKRNKGSKNLSKQVKTNESNDKVSYAHAKNHHEFNSEGATNPQQDNDFADPHRTESSRPGNRKKTAMIIGDSMVKNVHSWRLKAALKQNVKVRSFSGAKTTDMMHYTKPAMDENAELYIVHFGTNDLRSDQNPQEIAEKIVCVAMKMKTDANNVVISGLCPRGDEYNDKATKVNEHLESICNLRNIGFIKNENIDATRHLNNSKLHLNRNGDAILASNFRNMIKKY